MTQNDKWIANKATLGMIKPFLPTLIREEANKKVISYGLSSYGYDIRLSSAQFKLFKRRENYTINPKKFNPEILIDAELHHSEDGNYFILPANYYGLGVAMEYLDMPSNVAALCIGKSSYARSGLHLNTTPVEAGWRGHLTLEFSNVSGSDLMIFANEGIGQLIFFEGLPCSVDYNHRSGKYQDQPEEVIIAKV